MKNTPNLYKQLLSGLFLGLYLFITLPVQYWHHHSSANRLSANNTEVFAIVQSFDADNDPGIDCSICSHKYAAHSLDIDPTALVGIDNHTILYIDFSQPLLDLTYDDLLNKGPPAII